VAISDTRAGTLLVVLAVAAAESHAPAQRLACAAIRPGETAAAVARRVTGDARNRHEPWFQILDPSVSRFVAKGHYDRIRPGWRACVAYEPGRPAERARPMLPASQGQGSAGLGISRAGFWLVSWVALAIAFALVWSGVDDYIADRQRMLDAMRRFGETFVREFERPLMQPDDRERPIRSRLRASVHRRRLDILLAPGRGRRYPNLSDHRRNVDYDVRRVLQQLRDRPFTCGPLCTRGQWVVVPFRFRRCWQPAGGSAGISRPESPAGSAPPAAGPVNSRQAGGR
jgi:hypothetical protein